MEDFKNYTETELLKVLNDTKDDHERIKNEITQDTFKIEELEKTINEKLETLSELEKRYVEIIEEFENRK